MGLSLKSAMAAGLALAAVLSLGAAAAATKTAHPFGAAAVDKARQVNADSEPGTWMSAGRTYDEQRFSPLTQINTTNVSQLSLAWYGDIDTDAKQEDSGGGEAMSDVHPPFVLAAPLAW